MEYNPYHRIDYHDELRELPETYARAMSVDVSPFAAWLRAHQDKPLLATGAGGSLPIAQMAAHLHSVATGQLARAGEPMDLFHLPGNATNTVGLLVTASGGHSDSLAACRHLRETTFDWAVFCGREQSKGADILAGSSTPVFAYDLLPELHGWIAVNALLGQAVVLARAYAEAFPEALGTLSSSFAETLPGGASTIDDAVADLVRTLTAPLSRERLIFLYGPETKAAALDLDSKFAESGLGFLSLSEYRNFAHGRYQMLLPEPDTFGVVAFITERERQIANATLQEIPEQIAHADVVLPMGAGAAAEQVAAMVALLALVGAIGTVRDLKPGWGSANTFGDVLYEFDLEEFFPSATSVTTP